MTNITKKIESVRAQIADLGEQLIDPANSSPSREELRADFCARIDLWHDEASDLMLDRIKRQAAGEDVDLLVPEFNQYEDPRAAVDTLAKETRAWLTLAIGREGLYASFLPLLDEMPEGLDAEKRAKRLSDIRDQITALEVKEEQYLRTAEREGIEWEPRPGQRAAAAILMEDGK
ncbi:hypothetical protein [Variovorax sp. GT1P44]|uniref:hypothetical protein n=1 Tax=Variovorax sp. GT1P44 TaxID=3443742 RepID=UPI003F47EDAF